MIRSTSLSILVLVGISIALLLPLVAKGQLPPINAAASEAEKEMSSVRDTASPGPPFSCGGVKGDVELACLNALKANYDYEKERLDHTRAVFSSQLVVADISFVIVLLLVISGLIFAYLQFRWSLSHANIASAPTGADWKDVTQFELSFRRIKLRSSILGVTILGLAMAFFYIYIRFVFPIHQVAPS